MSSVFTCNFKSSWSIKTNHEIKFGVCWLSSRTDSVWSRYHLILQRLASIDKEKFLLSTNCTHAFYVGHTEYFVWWTGIYFDPYHFFMAKDLMCMRHSSLVIMNISPYKRTLTIKNAFYWNAHAVFIPQLLTVDWDSIGHFL